MWTRYRNAQLWQHLLQRVKPGVSQIWRRLSKILSKNKNFKGLDHSPDYATGPEFSIYFNMGGGFGWQLLHLLGIRLSVLCHVTLGKSFFPISGGSKALYSSLSFPPEKTLLTWWLLSLCSEENSHMEPSVLTTNIVCSYCNREDSWSPTSDIC